ncbi:unnamed protein product [Sympodiomycopsis kandeliae]
MNPKVFTWLCGCYAALGSILFGYDLGVIAGVLQADDFLETTGRPSTDYIGFITSSLLLGAFVATIPGALIADRFSRRTAIMFGAVVFILGGALQTGANGKGMMMAGRFIAGFGIGVLTMLAPLYQSEIAHPSIRGRLTTLQQFFLGIGALAATCCIYGTSQNYQGTVFEWRFPLALQILPALPLACLTMLLPESPRWLMAQGREEEALSTLARLHSRGDINDTFVRAEIVELRTAIEIEKRESKGWKAFISEPQAFRKVMIGIILQFSVQMTGVSAIQYYAPDIFATFGYGVTKTLQLQVINSVIALIGQAACVLLIDRLGRRWPLILANAASGLTFIVGTILQARFPNGGPNFNPDAARAFVAMTWIYNFCFSSGIGPLSWAVPVEIFNTDLRAKGTALTSMSCWIANFMIGQITPKALASIGWRFYILFSICCFTNALTFYLILPETKGRTLEEMDQYFEETPWIVIFSQTKSVGHAERERQLAAGLALPGTKEIEVIPGDAEHSGSDSHSEKKDMDGPAFESIPARGY